MLTFLVNGQVHLIFILHISHRPQDTATARSTCSLLSHCIPHYQF